MKRFRRYIFNTLTVVSLLLMLATVGLWVDSYDNSRQVDTEKFGVGSWQGVCVCGIISIGLSRKTLRDWYGFGYGETGWIRLSELGAAYIVTITLVSVPHWFLTLIFALLPALWLFKWNKRRKLGLNACHSCGYDLTGNESGVCPECGVGTAEITSDPA